jgi:hypothetical protein
VNGDQYTIIESEMAWTLQGKTESGADAFLTRSAKGAFTFGATGTQEQLRPLAVRVDALIARNYSDADGVTADRNIYGKDEKFTVVQSGTTFTLQGYTANGAQAFASLNGDKYSFGATGTVEQLDALGLRATEIRTQNLADNGGLTVSREIQTVKGKFTAVQAEDSFTLQGNTANGAKAFATLDKEGAYSFGASGSLIQLDALGLRASDLLDQNKAGNNPEQLILADEGNYTAVDSAGNLTLQGETANGAKAFATISAEGKFSYGATGTVQQLNQLGLRAGELRAWNQSQAAVKEILAKEGEQFTVVLSEGSYTLQGLTANGATAFVTLGKDGDFLFGATGTLAQLDELGLQASGLLRQTQLGYDAQRTIQPGKDDKYTAVETKGS